MPLAIEDVRKTMPKIGDHLEKKLSNGTKEDCVVTYINLENLWYQVTFKNGMKTCFKMPTSKPFRYDDYMTNYGFVPKQGKRRKVRVLETGKEYPTVKECARALGVSDTHLRRSIYERKKFRDEFTVVYAD